MWNESCSRTDRLHHESQVTLKLWNQETMNPRRRPTSISCAIACALLGCASRNPDAASEHTDAAAKPDVEGDTVMEAGGPDAEPANVDASAGDADGAYDNGGAPVGRLRGFVGVEQLYEDQAQGPLVIAEQFFVSEIPCLGDLFCTWTATPNDCGGVTYMGRGYLGRPFSRDLAGFAPFLGDQSAKAASAGDVSVVGQMGPPILVPSHMALFPWDVVPYRQAVIEFEPMEVIHVAANGGVVPPFAADVEMPSRVTFSTPDLTKPIVSAHFAPLEIRWTSNGTTGTVEAWSACAFTPDAMTTAVAIQCAAPVSAGRLVIPQRSMPECWLPMAGNNSSGIAIRVVNTLHRRVGDWEVQLSAASFDSGFILFADAPSDAGGD